MQFAPLDGDSRDLHVVNAVAIPDRLEKAVGETKRHDGSLFAQQLRQLLDVRRLCAWPCRARFTASTFATAVSCLEINVAKRLAARVLNDKPFVQPLNGLQPRKRRDLTVAGITALCFLATVTIASTGRTAISCVTQHLRMD
jgi:hypothetical protein